VRPSFRHILQNRRPFRLKTLNFALPLASDPITLI
jgi:hypothetical protein